ncbi:MAG: poly-gamma-glutamate system protein [Planctomycetaceae bacterium]|nr:poly-gamma-glutamate system protein [Planctomycetaceae bacterium]
MKSVYWKPQKISRRVLLSVGVLSVLGWTLVELCPNPDPHRITKHLAAIRAKELMGRVKQERLRRKVPIHESFDVSQSGLVGSPMTMITSRPANLQSKQTSVNPNFAAVVVDMLSRAGVEAGDTVAVGWSGSFPAFNLAVCAAMEAMELRPVIIASATSSQYGANDPDFMWIDMETALRQQAELTFSSVAVSIGGGADRGLGMSADAIAMVRTAILRNQLPVLESMNRKQAIDRRMALYDQFADGHSIAAYINVGGGVASSGGEKGKHLFQVGLNRHVSRQALSVDSVMSRFATNGCPIVHLVEARELASRFSLPIAPSSFPAVGTGRAFSSTTYNRWLAAGVLCLVVFALRSYLLSPLGHRVHTWMKSLWSSDQPRLRVVNEKFMDQQTEPQLMA